MDPTIDCLFCKIARKEIPSNIIFEDDLVLAFDDIYPKAPIHKLIIPREHIATLNDLRPEHNNLIGHMTFIASKLAKELGIDEKGYRAIINCNKDGGQMVFHIHMHLLGGRPLSWPPG